MAEIAKLPKLTFSTREVAAMLGVSRPTVDRLVADGFLPSIDLGPTRRTLIPAWAIEELLAAPRRSGGGGQASSGLAT
jgi:excisionase family DNA binding protein